MAADPRRTALGFSLVEVPAVLAVLAGLVALPLPALARARARAQTLRCQDNLRQIGLPVRVYLDDEVHSCPRNLSSLRLDPWGIWGSPSYQPIEPRRRDPSPQDSLENAWLRAVVYAGCSGAWPISAAGSASDRCSSPTAA